MSIHIPQLFGTVKKEYVCLRRKTAEVCQILGYEYDGSCWAHYGDGDDTPAAFLPEGCLMLEQIVGMLKAKGIEWGHGFGWVRRVKGCPDVMYRASTNPHDADAAVDVLLKVLKEEKQ